MKKEIKYFKIGNSNGGNQSWLRTPMMKLGGCAAITACDMSVFLGINMEKDNLYPYNLKYLHKEDYIEFAMKMKKYLKPRIGGISKLTTYIEGYRKYLIDVGETGISINGFLGEESLEAAKEIICKQIDNEIPIPYLLLHHKSQNFRYFKWHWFMIVGYNKTETDYLVKVATYGSFYWIPLGELWETGYERKGGMLIFECK